MGSVCGGNKTSQWMLSSSRSTVLVKNSLVHGTLKADVIFGSFECAVEKREWSLDSFRQESDGVIRCLGSMRTVILHAQTPFVPSDAKRPLLSVGKLTKNGAELKFGSKGSWIDFHTDTGMQRVLVRLKGKTFGLSIQKTDAWIIPETSDSAPHAAVAPVGEEIGRSEAPKPAPAAAAAPRRGDSRNAARARSLRPCSSLAELATVGTTTRRGRTRVAATLKTCETG